MCNRHESGIIIIRYLLPVEEEDLRSNWSSS